MSFLYVSDIVSCCFLSGTGSQGKTNSHEETIEDVQEDCAQDPKSFSDQEQDSVRDYDPEKDAEETSERDGETTHILYALLSRASARR